MPISSLLVVAAAKDYVGQPPFTNDKMYATTPVGVTMGLAWTSMGGDTLYIEAAAVEQGEGKVGSFAAHTSQSHEFSNELLFHRRLDRFDC
jgi:ATP-dependent Lon protease